MKAKDPIKRSVDSLEGLYTVVVALAITIAIQKILFNTKGDLYPFFDEHTKEYVLWIKILDYLPALLAFFATIVPFYHGMNRHLDRIYVERKVPINKEGYLVIDFIVFFIEACLLVVIASIVTSGKYTFLVLMLLLLVDSLWAFATYGIHYGAIQPSTIRWGIINILTVIVLGFFYFSTWFEDTDKKWALCIITFVRSAVDYIFCWRFYFPKEEEKSQ
ncbi:MAG: hypothetical protein ABSE63_11310 [Thermoguttaceae bacterium]|jgi:hypothetical protein